jgi:predicted RNA-binding protein YlxR (DUF448 family)
MSKNKFLRTCLVTGKKLPADEMQRFTIIDQQIVFDEAKKNPGRGGYVLNDESVMAKLPKLKKKIQHFMKAQLL